MFPGGPDAVWLGAAEITPVGLELAVCLPPPGAAVFCGEPEVPVQAYATSAITNSGIPSSTTRRRQ